MSKNTNIVRNLNKTEKRYYEPGIGWVENTYIDGEKHGIGTAWYRSGRKKSESMWNRHKLHGVDTGRWHDNGARWWEDMWKAGEQHGVGTRWYENEQKERETYYIQGKIHTRIEWDEKGNITEANFPTLTQPKPKPKLNPNSTQTQPKLNPKAKKIRLTRK